MFSARPIGIGEVKRYFYGLVVYSELGRQKQLKRTYGKGLILVTVEQFSKCPFKVLDTIVDRRGVKRTLWIAPALFCSMPYINNAMYLPGYKTTDMVKT